jgi:hypothetical protein
MASASGPARRQAHSARAAQICAWMLVALACLGTLLLPAPSGADQNPPNCNQNNLALDIGRDKLIVRNGDTINYTISASNLDSPQGPACNLTGTTFVFIAPAADGTPNGARTVLRSNVDFPAGTTRTVLGTVPYVVAVNPGVTDTVAEATATGTLHDAPVNHLAQVVKTLGSTVTQPHTTLGVSVTVTGTSPPYTAQYTYIERNDSTTAAPMTSVALSDDQCAPITYVSGDLDNDHILQPGESWVFTCKKTITRAGAFVSHVTAGGVDSADSRAAPAESAQVTTTVTAATSVRGTFVLPVTGPSLPLAPLGALGVVLIGAGFLVTRRVRLRSRR